MTTTNAPDVGEMIAHLSAMQHGPFKGYAIIIRRMEEQLAQATGKFDAHEEAYRLQFEACARLQAEVERLRAVLAKIARTGACDYEYRAWAKAALATQTWEKGNG